MRKSLRYLLLLPVFLILMVNCEEDESYQPIEVETKEVVSVDYESAVITGKIIEFGKGIDAFGHCWSTDPIPSIEDDTTIITVEVGGDYQSTISGLVDGEKYYFRSYALNDEEIVYGEIKEFNTETHPLKMGLIAYYPFDGNTSDYSGNENNATNFGTTLTADRFGNVSSAYSFDGINDYIQLNNNEPVIESGSFTISCWAKMDGEGGGSSGQNNIFQQRGNSYYSSTIILIAENRKDSTGVYARTSTMGNEIIANEVACHAYGDWHHYIGKLSGSSLDLYIDGVLVKSVSCNLDGDFVTSVDYVDIGRHRYSYETKGFFNGVIDDFRIYNRALTDEEIQQLYHEGGWDE